MEWLIKMRQNDGGWVIGSPGLINHTWKDMCAITERMDIGPVKDFDRTKAIFRSRNGHGDSSVFKFILNTKIPNMR